MPTRGDGGSCPSTWPVPADAHRRCAHPQLLLEIIWHFKHYTGRGVMKFYEYGVALAKVLDIDVVVLF